MTRRTLVAVTAVVAVLGFTLVAVLYNRSVEEQAATAARSAVLVRPHSPVFGPKDAPVTIVEFFDPACGTCRAFHPIVKRIREEYPDTVRVVMRYTMFHQGSDQVVRILEAARLQGKLEPVLEAVLAAQSEWSSHGGAAPNIGKAWQAAGSAGLDVARARRDILRPEITAVLNQDMADVNAAGVNKTPTFFVNGKPLPSFGTDQLFALVREEVSIARGGS
ncbi:MAG: thioredoxin domain-containing protein [Alphaproteobacteria bacterium]|jgi:protein-disulfide isomerase|nr:thioredoxin domain-containing protein [Alphaproteobacteria bacterium]